MNPPSALYGAMSRDKKPFTYTPGGLDLSEIKSERMAKRLMRNAMNQGVPEVPVQQIQSPPANPVAVPNFNCMPVQVFPTFNLPANPKSLLRTRSNPDHPREPPAQKQPQQSQLPKTKTDTSSLTYSQTSNNNCNYQRPMSMYENNSNTLPMIPQGHDFTEPILPEISYEAEYFQTAPRSYTQNKSIIMKQNESEIETFKNYTTKLMSVDTASKTVMKEQNDCFGQNDISNKLSSQFKEPNDSSNIHTSVNSKDPISFQCDANNHAESNVVINKNTDSILNVIDSETSNRSKNVSPLFGDSLIDLDFSIKPISVNSSTPTSIETKPFDEELKSDDEQKQVKVVKKQQVKKESKTEVQNGNQNGDAGVEAELTVKLPSKKSAAKTETKVEVVKKQLPDGSIEEIKTTTTKTTVDGKIKIATKTETTIIPKEEEEEVEVEEEEENEEVEVQEDEENGEDEVVKQQVVEKATKIEKPSAVQNGKKESIIKREERTETQTTKKVTVTQKQEPEEVEEEEEEEEEEEIEETKPAVSEKKVSQKVVEEVEEENEEEEEPAKEEVIEVKQEKTVSKVEVKEEQEEVEEEEEEEEEEVVEKSERKEEEVVVEPKKLKQEEKVDEEKEEEEEELKEVVEEVKKEEVIQSKETKEDEESEYTEEEYESEKEDEIKFQPKSDPEESKKEPEAPAKTVEQEDEKETVQEEEEKSKPEPPKASEPTVPLREPSIPLDKVEDVEIKPISLSGAPLNETITKTVTSNTEITKTELPSSGPLSTQTEYNKYENILTINRTTKTLDHSYEQLTQHGVPTVKTYFAPPTREPVSISPTPSKPYQPVYPPTISQPTERRHSLLLERLSTERQMPTSDIYQNYQHNNQSYEQQKQWSQEPQAEVLTVSNVKPSKITNQQWYQNKDNVIYNNITPTTPASQPWSQPSYLSPTPQPQSQPSPQPQSQPQYLPSYTTQENTTNTYQQNNYQTYTPKPSTWGATNLNNTDTLSSSVNTQQNQYSYLDQNTTQSYQKTSQQYSSSYVPPPWEQDSSYVVDTSNQIQYQPPPPSTTYTPNTSQGWNPPPPKSKFTKTPPTSYIPPAPNQSFVKSVSVEPPRVPGKKTYYSEYERRYITVPESNYVPGETKFQPQPDPSPQYYYDNNEPAENIEPQWRKELREFTEKTSQTTTETTSVQPPWEGDNKYAKTPSVAYTPTPSWSQTLRPRSWRERSFESEYVGSQETQKTSTLGRGRPVSSYGQSQIETIPERPRGVSVDRYNPNSYQAPVHGEHPPVQSHTLNVTPSAKAYHNPNVPAYHANRVSAEQREQPVVYQQPRQHWAESRASPIQSRSFKYLQWITGTDE